MINAIIINPDGDQEYLTNLLNTYDELLNDGWTYAGQITVGGKTRLLLHKREIEVSLEEVAAVMTTGQWSAASRAKER